MKTFIISGILCLISSFVFSQVGIGTTNPTADLDINGNLRIRNTPLETVSNSLLSVDDMGNVFKANAFMLKEASTFQATTFVDHIANGSVTINDIDLGLSTSINIPANKEALVLISYSVPVGISSFSYPETSYYGVRFLEDGVENHAGSRKSSVISDGINSSSDMTNMTTINCFYTKLYSSSSVDRTITFTLKGYVEQHHDLGIHIYRFNMWDPSNENYNWGKATITKQVFLK